MRELTRIRQVLRDHLGQVFDVLARVPLLPTLLLLLRLDRWSFALLFGAYLVSWLRDVQNLFPQREEIHLKEVGALLRLSVEGLRGCHLFHQLVEVDEVVLLFVLDNLKLESVKFIFLLQKWLFQLPVPRLKLSRLFLGVLKERLVVLVPVLHGLEFLFYFFELRGLRFDVVVRFDVVLLKFHVKNHVLILELVVFSRLRC